MKRSCATRAVKRARHHRRHAAGIPGVDVAVSAAAALFKGTAYFARITFVTNGGSGSAFAVDPADMSTAIAYATAAAAPMSQYAGQYGPNALAIAQTAIEYSVTLPGTTYNDAELAQYVGEIAEANSLPPGSCVAVINPNGVVNTDADVTQGILGYHNYVTQPYLFINVLGQGGGFTLDDAVDQYADALSHEFAEMIVDPQANDANPEVCDPCAGNCNVDYRVYFKEGTPATYVGSSGTFPPNFAYDFFIAAIVQPQSASACPAPVSACEYPPPPPPGP